MQAHNKKGRSTILFLSSLLLIIGCKEQNPQNAEVGKNNNIEVASKKVLSEEFKKYWYAGKAEITSYDLEEARYGEIRKGKSVLIYVTEPFLEKEQVKADAHHKSNIPVLKFNSTKKFLTGIYPYSIMSSVFYPVYDDHHAIKVASSIQEWCGQQYIQLNNRKDFKIISHSYFDGEADQNVDLNKAILEDELWTKIRIDPDNLPKGNLQVIPSMEYIKLIHKQLKAYNAILTLDKKEDMSSYGISYPELKRSLTITFTTAFPHTIESWSETAPSGFGSKAELLTSTVKKIKTIKTAYWQENKNSDLFLRDTLGL